MLDEKRRNLKPELSRWIPGLDLLRASAVFLVLIGHGKILLPQASLTLFKQWLQMPAAWGVELFFSLSGFLIGKQWIAMNLSAAPATEMMGSFFRKRWLRTMPTYWLVLSAALLLGLATLPSPTLPALMINLSLTNWLLQTPYALPVSWTLAIEEFSYLIIGASVMVSAAQLRPLAPAHQLRVMVLMPILLIGTGVSIRIVAVLTNHWQDLNHNPLLRMDALAYGLLLAIMIHPSAITTVSQRTWQRSWIPCLVLAAIIGVQSWRMALPLDLNATNPVNGLIIGCLLLPALGLVTSSCVLMAASWSSSGLPLIDRAVKRLALISYSVYLIHIPLRKLLLRHLAAQTPLEGILLFSGYLLLSILLGEAIFRLAEQPFLRLKQQLFGRTTLSPTHAQPPTATAIAAWEDKR